MIRDPAVAGQFYPGTKEALLRELKRCSPVSSAREDALGVIAPHAGYPYSGAVAGATFAVIKPKPVYIIIGPNHTGMGKAFGLSSAEAWKTPLGEIAVADKLARRITESSKYIKYDDVSHTQEHSIEVELPFLQNRQKNFEFVPIAVSQAPLTVYRDIGVELAEAIKHCKLEGMVTMVASSDMTHYESHEDTKRKDKLAIEAILAMDEARLVETVNKHDISMCGYAPVAIMLAGVKELGATSARLVKYATSGDASGDYSSVVGYAGIIIK